MASGTRFLTFSLMTLMSGAVVLAQSTEVYDVGTKSGEPGSRQFAYFVISAGQPIMHFKVGTNDYEASRFTNVIVPPGWSFRIEFEGVSQQFGQNTPNGSIPMQAWTTGTVACAHWYTIDPASAVEVFEFGFDHPWSPHDVGWIIRGRTTSSPDTAWMARDEWFQPVGDGLGPLHGPGYSGTLCTNGGLYGCSIPGQPGRTYCDKPRGGCQGLGVCKTAPGACLTVYMPVCGCDGQTYPIDCEANAHGVSVAHYCPCGWLHSPPGDKDSDSILDGYDNCTLHVNPDQADTDADFVGDACDDSPNTITTPAVDPRRCIAPTPGDFDRDGDVDANDFDAFQACATGPAGGPPEQGCQDKDIDNDGDVDQEDFGIFQRCISGQGIPANPQCR